MEGMELLSFQIISAVGTARSMYIEAIQEAKNGKFDEAEALIAEGSDMFVQGHHAHAELIQKGSLRRTNAVLNAVHACRRPIDECGSVQNHR
jgi:cellobiose PTS system EIIA component